MARLDPFDRPQRGVAEPVGEATLYRERARRLGLPFASRVVLTPGSATSTAAVRRGTIAIAAGRDGTAYIAPEEDTLPMVLGWINRHGSVRRRLMVATPSAIRAALIDAGKESFATEAVEHLGRIDSDLCARRVVTRRQVALGAMLAMILAGSAVVSWQATLIALNLVAAGFFFAVTMLRFAAARLAAERVLTGSVASRATGDAELPVYTVLVPLHREAGMVRGLVAALDRLNWPRDRLDIKLIVEATDAPTVAAARAATEGAPYEVVVVPPVGPRTKPKALAFALPFARGELVTVYDAEDRPHPQQLREAYAALRRAPREVACVQATLRIDRLGEARHLGRLFAVEYAALFDGLLPALAALRFPLPLGGTSNHFRRAALEEVGGWDPYNVTEDADLGLRLARFGYRTATIDLPTLEEAPPTLKVWVNQRTRWFKGWFQTWLVHTRTPLRAARELGWRGFVGFNLTATGLLVSALIHPLYIATLIVAAVNPLHLWGDGGSVAAALIGLNLFNLFAGYVSVALLSLRALRLRGRPLREGRVLFLLPLYWGLTSFACYRAIVQLARRPHFWDKTPHRAGPAPAPIIFRAHA